MPADPGLAARSDDLLFVAVLVYSVAMLCFAAEWAFGRAGRVARAASTVHAGSREAVLVGAGAPAGAGAGRTAGSQGPDGPPAGARTARAGEGARPPAADGLGRAAVGLTVVAWLLHLTSVVLRGVAAGRVPWGNMYEFTSAVSLVAVTVFLVLLLRSPVRYLGAFVLLPTVLSLGIAATVLYTTAGPLVPALNSYWITIHVSAAVIAFGVFTVAAVVSVLYLLRARWEARAGASSGRTPVRGLGRLLPPSERLDALAYRVTAFAFPIWTFAIIAGAIWAREAWTRAWGWDPKETWSFISWVLYAAYLHARATAGWRGRRATVVGLVAFGSMLVNYFVVNLVVEGLHSYGGV